MSKQNERVVTPYNKGFFYSPSPDSGVVPPWIVCNELSKPSCSALTTGRAAPFFNSLPRQKLQDMTNLPSTGNARAEVDNLTAKQHKRILDFFYSPVSDMVDEYLRSRGLQNDFRDFLFNRIEKT